MSTSNILFWCAIGIAVLGLIYVGTIETIGTKNIDCYDEHNQKILDHVCEEKQAINIFGMTGSEKELCSYSVIDILLIFILFAGSILTIRMY